MMTRKRGRQKGASENACSSDAAHAASAAAYPRFLGYLGARPRQTLLDVGCGSHHSDYFRWRLTGQPGTAQAAVSETLMTVSEWMRVVQANGFAVVARLHDTWPTEAPGASVSACAAVHARRALLRLVWATVPLRDTYQAVFLLCSEGPTRRVVPMRGPCGARGVYEGRSR